MSLSAIVRVINRLELKSVTKRRRRKKKKKKNDTFLAFLASL